MSGHQTFMMELKKRYVMAVFALVLRLSDRCFSDIRSLDIFKCLKGAIPIPKNYELPNMRTILARNILTHQRAGVNVSGNLRRRSSLP